MPRRPHSEETRRKIRRSIPRQQIRQRMQERWAQRRGDSDGTLLPCQPTLPPHPILFADLAPSSLTDRQLVESVIVQSANPPRTTLEMIQATWNFHVSMYGREAGYRVWRRSLEEICQLGREECEVEDRSTLKVQ